jgi:hypothetical protein
MSGVKFKFDPTAPSSLVPTQPIAAQPNDNVPVPNQPIPVDDVQPPASVSTEPVIPATEPAPISVSTEPVPAPAPAPAPVTEPIKAVEPTPAPVPPAPVYDEETQKFLRFQTETGRTMKDWIALNEDLSKSNPIELAKERIIMENAGVDLTPADINFLLEDALGFDPTVELDPKESALFKKFWGAQLKTKLSEQQKYNTPLDGYTSNSQQDTQPALGAKVKLTNGLEVDEDSYNKDRQNYLTQRSLQVEALTEEKFVLAIDTKDGKKDLAIDYSISPDDKRKMYSMTDDLGSILERFTDPQTGQLNHAQLNSKLLRIDDDYFNKLLSVAATKIRSEVIAELTGSRRNLQLDAPNTPPAPVQNSGYAKIGDNVGQQGLGVKFAFDPNKKF